MSTSRIKVKIHCRQCGENYVLRGVRAKDRVDTGFKRCLCDNDRELDIEEVEY